MYTGYQNEPIHPDAVHVNSNIVAPSNNYSNNYERDTGVQNVYGGVTNVNTNVNVIRQEPISYESNKGV